MVLIHLLPPFWWIVQARRSSARQDCSAMWGCRYRSPLGPRGGLKIDIEMSSQDPVPDNKGISFKPVGEQRDFPSLFEDPPRLSQNERWGEHVGL